MQKKIFLTAVILSSATLLFGCKASAPATSTTAAPSSVPSTTQKKGTTQKTGKILKLGAQMYLQESGQSPLGIDSYSLDLSKYIGQTVTVSGEYSGDTLFITKIQ